MTTIPTTALDAAIAAYHLAAGQIATAALADLTAATLAAFPDATDLTLTGAYNEDGEVRITIDQVNAYEPAGRLSAEDGNAEQIEALEEACEEALMYLADVTGEDYLGETTIDLHVSACANGCDCEVGAPAVGIGTPEQVLARLALALDEDTAEGEALAEKEDAGTDTVRDHEQREDSYRDLASLLPEAVDALRTALATGPQS